MPGPQSYRQTIMALRRAKLELQHAKDTLNGHQQTAIDACDKAIRGTGIRRAIKRDQRGIQAAIRVPARRKASAAMKMTSGSRHDLHTWYVGANARHD